MHFKVKQRVGLTDNVCVKLLLAPLREDPHMVSVYKSLWHAHYYRNHTHTITTKPPLFF